MPTKKREIKYKIPRVKSHSMHKKALAPPFQHTQNFPDAPDAWQKGNEN